MNNRRLKLYILVFLILAPVTGRFAPSITGLYAQSAHAQNFEQKLQWQAEKNAWEYKVEVRTVSGGSSTFHTTTTPSITLNLSSGDYQYRVFAYDFLGRESSVSEWRKFTVIKAVAPQINVPKEVETAADSAKKLSVPVEVTNIEKESKVELINTETKQVVQGTLQTKTTNGEVVAASAEFPAVNEGNWKVKVTNPSGLSSESSVIQIEDKAAIEAARKKAEQEEKLRLAAEEKKRQEEEKQKAEAEKQKLEDEKKRLAEEKKLAEQQRLADEAERKRLAEEEKLRQEEEKRLAAEAEKKRKEEEKRRAEEEELKRKAEEQRQREEARRLAEENAKKRQEEMAKRAAEAKEREQALKAQREENKRKAAETRAANAEKAKQVEEKQKENLAELQKEWDKLDAERKEREAKEEEERKIKEKKLAEERKAKDKKLAEERKAKERKAARDATKEFWKNKNYIDLNVQAGAGAVMNLYDGQLFNYSARDYIPAVKAEISYLPFDKGRIKFGFGVNGIVSYLTNSNEYVNYDLPYGIFNALGIVHLPLIGERVYAGFKLGTGLSLISVNLTYNELFDRTQKAAPYYGYIDAQAGACIYWLVTRVVTLEAGVDFTHIFITDMPTGNISPYMTLGVRF